MSGNNTRDAITTKVSLIKSKKVLWFGEINATCKHKLNAMEYMPLLL